MSADFFFERVGREIADGEEDGVVGTIPRFVERAERGGVGRRDHRFIADRISPRAEGG